jgi:hypothetical protein
MAHFVRSFDCKIEEHAMWLKKVGGVMARSIGGESIDILSTVNTTLYQETLLSIIPSTLRIYIFNCV